MLCKLLQPPQSIHYCLQSHKFLITQFLQYLLLQVNSCLSPNQYTGYIQMATSGSNVQCSFLLLLKYNIKLFLSTSINQMQVNIPHSLCSHQQTLPRFASLPQHHQTQWPAGAVLPCPTPGGGNIFSLLSLHSICTTHYHTHH